MTTLTVYTFREDDDNLYVKNLDENEKPTGHELTISWGEWGALENKQRIKKNIWTFEISKELQERVDYDTKRIAWLMKPERIVVLLMTSANKLIDITQVYELSEISRQYQVEFPKDRLLEFTKYACLAVDHAKAMSSNP